jgi:glycosyltransferase involved in cell wall biosynthesis/GT2 family glycosyltransferase
MFPSGVDVIIPVRAAGAVFRRCAASLARHDDAARHRLIVVLDGPADEETTSALGELRAADIEPVILAHESPLGFVASANRGMASSDRDVVLLNSDTQVTDRWLTKMRAAAYADEQTATVTPFSNNATICSLPQFLHENTLPAGWTLDALAARVEQVSRREYPVLPTGVGVCLYIKRHVLSVLGLFSDTFGAGYGEEVDFCLRATARGYRHVLDDATFIYHEGSRSFGASRRGRVRQAHRLIDARYPTYQQDVHAFIQRDPLRAARERVVSALTPPRAWRETTAALPRVLHVVHGWPPWAHGGTELYAHWLAHEQAQTRDTAVYARIADRDRSLGDVVEHLDGGVRVRLVANNFVERNPFVRNGLHSQVLARDFARFIDDVRPHLIHVHHLAGHCASLLGIARRRGVPIVYQAQDWWPICARMNLLDANEQLCAGPGAITCGRCLPLTRLGPAPLASAALHVVRRAFIRRQLRHVDAVIAGSRFIADSYREHAVLPSAVPVHVVPYGVSAGPARSPHPAVPRQPMMFGVVGALMPHKGIEVALEAFRQLPVMAAELHVWGSSEDRAYGDRLAALAEGRPDIQLRGAFSECDKRWVLESFDVLIVPSIGLESFGLVAREAMALGVPVVASRRGALQEMFADGDGGTFFDAGDATALAGVVRRILGTPDLVARWRERLPVVKTAAQHASEIESVYRSLTMPNRR